MSPAKPVTPIPRRVAIGFSVIIVLSWIVEIIHLPSLFFGEPSEFIWTRVLFRTAVIGAVWLWVHLTTKRLLKRLRYLEEFLLVCSWCRKVGHDGEWLTMEEYFGSKLDTKTSHGICPTCYREHLDAHFSREEKTEEA